MINIPYFSNQKNRETAQNVLQQGDVQSGLSIQIFEDGTITSENNPFEISVGQILFIRRIETPLNIRVPAGYYITWQIMNDTDFSSISTNTTSFLNILPEECSMGRFQIAEGNTPYILLCDTYAWGGVATQLSRMLHVTNSAYLVLRLS